MKQVWKNFHSVLAADASHFPVISSLPKKTSHKKLPATFTLLVWNVYKRIGGKTFHKDLADLDTRSHISCLQEMLAQNKEDLPLTIRAQNLHFALSYKRLDGYFEGIVTASHYAMSDSCIALKSLGREPLTKTPKMALITFLQLENGQTLLLINVHMLLFKNAVLFYQELERIVKACAKQKDLPAIFCGDFNTFLPWQLAMLDRKLAKYGFFRCKAENRRRSRLPLDHVYARGIELLELEIMYGVSSSDHSPILCKFKC